MSALDWFELIGGLLGWLVFAWLLVDRRRNRADELPALASIRLGELRPFRWAILDESDRRWLLVQSEYRSGDDGGTVTLILRTEESVRRSARIEP